MSWFDIIPKIKLLLRYESPPEILVIHCGANDIGKIPLLRFRAIMQSTITELNQILPNTTIGWSNMLPRISWRFSSDVKSQNLAAIRLNNFMNRLVSKMVGFVLNIQKSRGVQKRCFVVTVFICQTLAILYYYLTYKGLCNKCVFRKEYIN